MNVAKGVFAALVGGLIVYVQLFEVPRPCMEGAQCVGQGIAWLAIWAFGAYALWRGVRLLVRPNRGAQKAEGAVSRGNHQT